MPEVRDEGVALDRLAEIRGLIETLAYWRSTPDEGPQRPVNRLIKIRNAESAILNTALEDVPWLIAEVERLRAINAVAERDVQAWATQAGRERAIEREGRPQKEENAMVEKVVCPKCGEPQVMLGQAGYVHEETMDVRCSLDFRIEQAWQKHRAAWQLPETDEIAHHHFIAGYKSAAPR